jgi:hypothetical protein
MARRLALALAAIEGIGYLIVATAAALVDLRAGLAVLGIVLVIEAREAAKP